MTRPLTSIKVSEKVHWVGASDWNIRNFHGYSTQRGTTYNAYLILADKITLVDSVKYPFREELLARIASVVPPEKIDYVVSNHSEMDHSGALPWIVDRVRPEKVFASQNGVKALAAHFGPFHEVHPLKTGDRLSLGNMELSFVETRMLHWPDSMFSYLKEEQVLFSQDAFGMHLATSRIFDDENSEAILDWEAKKYFANILMPFSDLILKALKEFAALKLPVRMILPDHGPVWRANPGKILSRYQEWSLQPTSPKAVIAYDTMWGSTAMMAQSIGEGLRLEGLEIKEFCLTESHRSDVVTELLDAGALIVGSPTINNNMFPTVADILCYVRGLRPKNKIGAAFGSFGWSGEAVPQIAEALNAMGISLPAEPLKFKYVPSDADLMKCRELGAGLGRSVKETAVKKI